MALLLNTKHLDVIRVNAVMSCVQKEVEEAHIAGHNYQVLHAAISEYERDNSGISFLGFMRRKRAEYARASGEQNV